MQLTQIGKPLVKKEISTPVAGEGQVVVFLKYAALNRRDYWMMHGQYPRMALPVTPGSDGAGVCIGVDVVINPGLAWGNSERLQSPHFHILGMPDNGTLAEAVLVPEEQVFPKPAHLNWAEAAALPLAGVTAYRALFVQGQAQPGQKVLITGVGGGVALMAMQFCVAHGMEVCVTSGHTDKLDRALSMGVVDAVNYREADWVQALSSRQDGFDLILDSAGGEAFSLLPKLVRPGGRIVIYGGTLGKIQNLSPQVIFWRQISIIGSTMGSPKDFQEMLAFVSQHKIRPVVESVFDLNDANAALDKLKDSTQFGKVVIRIAP